MSVRWIVRREDPRTVGEILAKSGNDPAAVSEGRVFVGKRRCTSLVLGVTPGDVVTIANPTTRVPVTVLLRQGDLVAVAKPAGIPTIADHGGGDHSLAASVARELDVSPAIVHATSRLDRDVSGVVVFALSKAVAARLVEARANHEYQRRYVAIGLCKEREKRERSDDPPWVAGTMGTWDAPIGRARDPRHRRVMGEDAVPSKTHFIVVARAESYALLALSPVTGRTHQIRVHASHGGLPLLGDRVYGGPTRTVHASGRVVTESRIALHAARVTLPGDSGPLTLLAPIPEEMAARWRELGGDASAWDTALSCILPTD